MLYAVSSAHCQVVIYPGSGCSGLAGTQLVGGGGWGAMVAVWPAVAEVPVQLHHGNYPRNMWILVTFSLVNQ